MRGLDPRIHVFWIAEQGVDGRDKPGHDDGVRSALNSQRHSGAPRSGEPGIFFSIEEIPDQPAPRAVCPE
jgi:hypothetical protein